MIRDGGDLNGNGEDDEIPMATWFGATDTFGSYNLFYRFTGAFGCADSYHVIYKSCNNVREFAGRCDCCVGRILQLRVVALETGHTVFALQSRNCYVLIMHFLVCNFLITPDTEGTDLCNILFDHLRIVDGKVTFTATDEAFKKTAEFFNMLYEEGLIWNGSFEADESLSFKSSLIKENVAKIGSFGVCCSERNFSIYYS